MPRSCPRKGCMGGCAGRVLHRVCPLLPCLRALRCSVQGMAPGWHCRTALRPTPALGGMLGWVTGPPPSCHPHQPGLARGSAICSLPHPGAGVPGRLGAFPPRLGLGRGASPAQDGLARPRSGRRARLHPGLPPRTRQLLLRGAAWERGPGHDDTGPYSPDWDETSSPPCTARLGQAPEPLAARVWVGAGCFGAAVKGRPGLRRVGPEGSWFLNISHFKAPLGSLSRLLGGLCMGGE